MVSKRWLAISGIFTLSALSLMGCESIDQKIEKSTVLITYGDTGGNGSGFFIKGPKEICAVLTASHVLASDDLKIRTHDEKIWAAANTQQIPNLDMAVVTFKPEGSECPYKPLSFGDPNKVKRGETINVAGFPASQQLVFQFIPGEVTAITPPRVDGYAISYTAPTNGGTSGGPVVNEVGQVVAVHGLTDVEVRQLTNLREGNLSGEEAQASGTPVAYAGLKWGIPIDRFPKDLIISTQPDVLSQARKWLSFGDGSYARKDYQSALNAYEEAIKIKADYPEVWWSKGLAQSSLKKYEDAIKSYDEAIKLKPNYAFAWNDRGVALDRLEKYQEAFESFDKATKINPNYALAWRNRGANLLYDLERYQEAVDSYERSIKIEPDSSISWYRKGQALFKLQEYEQALASFEQAVKLDPDYKSVFLDKAIVINQYSSALAFLDKATEIDPNNKNAWDRKCTTLNRLKLYAAALDACNQSNTIHQNNHDTWDERGIALENLQRYEEALKSYEKALEIKPDYSWSIKGRDRMMSKLAEAEQ